MSQENQFIASPWWSSVPISTAFDVEICEQGVLNESNANLVDPVVLTSHPFLLISPPLAHIEQVGSSSSTPLTSGMSSTSSGVSQEVTSFGFDHTLVRGYQNLTDIFDEL